MCKLFSGRDNVSCPEIGLHFFLLKKREKMRKCKAKKGLKNIRFFTLKEKKIIIEEYLREGGSKSAIWYKYTGDKDEHGAILKWMRQLGYQAPYKPVFLSKPIDLPSPLIAADMEKEDPKKLKKRIKELEGALEDSKLKAEMYAMMIDIAEKEFKISIKKKSDTR